MRVLIWGNCYPRVGGIETFITNLARALIDRNVEIAVVGDGTMAMKLDRPFPITLIPMSNPLLAADPVAILQAIKAARAVIDAFNPDLIHYHIAGTEMFVFDRVTRAIDVPCILTLHNGAFVAEKAGSFRNLIGRAAAITTVSNFIHTMVQRRLSDEVPIQLIPNSIPAIESEAEFPLDKHILALGRIVPAKGFDILVDAFSMVLATHPDARLTIAGEGPDLDTLRARTAALGISGSVSFPGWIAPDDVHAAMGEACMIIFPSRWEEPFGLVALEAGRAARPCVATAVGELPSIIVDGETGYSVPGEDPAAMANAINRLLDDSVAAREMGRRAKQWTHDRFNFDAMVDAYRAIYARVAKLA